MTADEAIELAAYHRPGVRLIVGPTDAREEFGVAADYLPMSVRNHIGVKKHGEYPIWQSSFWARDLYNRLGFFPSGWAISWAHLFECFAGRDVTVAEWEWLASPATSVANVQAWVQPEAQAYLARMLEGGIAAE